MLSEIEDYDDTIMDKKFDDTDDINDEDPSVIKKGLRAALLAAEE